MFARRDKHYFQPFALTWSGNIGTSGPTGTRKPVATALVRMSCLASLFFFFFSFTFIHPVAINADAVCLHCYRYQLRRGYFQQKLTEQVELSGDRPGPTWTQKAFSEKLRRRHGGPREKSKGPYKLQNCEE